MNRKERAATTAIGARHSNEIGCSILATIELIGDRKTLGILRCVMYGYRRFGDFERELGVATNILSERLRTLVEAGVLERVQYSERPPRYDYVLSEAAGELVPAFLLFKSWGDRHLRGMQGPVTRLVHQRCGQTLDPVLVCRECGDPIHLDDLSVHWIGDAE